MSQPSRRIIEALIALAVLAAVAAWLWRLFPANPQPLPEGINEGTVEFAFDDSLHEAKRHSVAYSTGMTVLTGLERLQNDGKIRYTARGTGIQTLVDRIDDVANEGGGTQAKNWVFYVNGQRSNSGCGAAAVWPGDVVLWKFEAWR